MKTLETMTQDARSLLLFLETRAVDHGGRVNAIHMNVEDMHIAKQWNQEGFVGFGRVASEDITHNGAHWCKLSDEAWKLAAEERKARAERTWLKKRFNPAYEKRQSV
jgi:hypothetical protein